MKRIEMVKKHDDFNDIINNGKKTSGKYLIIFFKEKEYDKPNFGIAVGKKIGNAVIRNKNKRIIRNIVDNNKFLFKKHYNYIIMIKKDITNISYNEVEMDLKSILKG